MHALQQLGNRGMVLAAISDFFDSLLMVVLKCHSQSRDQVL